MILVRGHSVIQSTNDLREMSAKELSQMREAFDTNNVTFFIPAVIKKYADEHSNKGHTNALLEAYKVGFTKAVLEILYPDKKNKEIWEIIRNKFQVFATTRKMEMRITLYNKTEQLHVFDKD